MSAAQIISISSAKAAALHPVVDDEGRCPKFTTSNPVLYESGYGHGAGTTYPTCFSIADLAAGTLELNITIRTPVFTPADSWYDQWVAAEGSLVTSISSTDTVSIGGIVGDPGSVLSGSFGTPGIGPSERNVFTGSITLNLGSLAKLNKTPWGFKGNLSYTSTLASPNFTFATDTFLVPLEIYAVGAYPALYLMIEGIPVDLLRLALLPTTTVSNFKTITGQGGYPAYAGQLVFSGTGFVYETGGGNPNFCQGGGKGFSDFDLRRFLHYWTLFGQGHPVTNEAKDVLAYNPHANTVNCFDQTAILWLVLSLCFQSEKDQNAVTSYFMSPYGFIKSELVGWGHTNNPFFNYDTNKANLPELDHNRQPFGSHVFLSWYDKIFDSCAGPHLGTENLQDYIVNAIDPMFWEDYADAEGTVWENGNKDDAKSAGASEKRRGHIGGIGDYFDAGRYMPEGGKDRQIERAKAVKDKLKGKGYNGLPVLALNLQTAITKLGYTDVIVTNPNFWPSDFNDTSSKENIDLGYIKFHAGASNNKGVRMGVDFKMYICNTPEAALAYMKDKGKKTSNTTGALGVQMTTDTTTSISIYLPGYTDAQWTRNNQTNHVYKSLPIRFCMQNLYLELLIGNMPWGDLATIVRAFINVLSSGLQMTEGEPIAVYTDINYRISGATADSVYDCADINAMIALQPGQSVTMALDVDGFKDIDWRYNKESTGCIIVRNWSAQGSTVTIDVYAREAGEDVLTLNFFDQWFKTDGVEIYFKVGSGQS
ncbi:hypothetical protein TWF694_011217 [Orbilia ellipsospora]|uniref:Uncharacterized protein n=1 Tax=Orbilia ellipsospora TaxID=2528407 RepID=A0AAV9XER0_9PEZI